MKPFGQSYWVREGLWCVGQFPGAPDAATRDEKLTGLLDCGIRHVLNLMESTESNYGGQPFAPYEDRLRELAARRSRSVECVRLPLRDGRAPERAALERILDTLEEWLAAGTPTYMHCWGGHGRTSTVVACFLIREGLTADEAFGRIRTWRSGLPKRHWPFEGGQEEFVRAWRDARA